MEKKETNILQELQRTQEGKYILPLSSPIKHGQREVTELHLSELKAKHIRKMPTNPTMDDVLKVCGQLAAEPDSLIDELSLKDCNKLSEYVQAFS